MTPVTKRQGYGSKSLIRNDVLRSRIEIIKQDKTHVRNHQVGKFIMDDKFVTGEYMRVIGHAASMVYTILCKYADATQTAWPSIATVNKYLGLGTRQIVRGIKLLEKYKLIKVYRMPGRSSAYRLLDASEWAEAKPIIVRKYILKRKHDESPRRIAAAS